MESSGWRALEELRGNGLLKAIGAGINELGMMERFLAFCEPDFWLVAMPYTLLRQDVLDDEFPACEERGVGFVIGAPFQSGILAGGSGGRLATTIPIGTRHQAVGVSTRKSKAQVRSHSGRPLRFRMRLGPQ